MKPQQLTERITVEKPTRVSDGLGGSSTIWEVVGTFWAQPLFGSSSASLDFARVEVRSGVDFVIRRQVAEKVSPDYRVLYKQKTYIITGIASMAGEVYSVLNTQTDD